MRRLLFLVVAVGVFASRLLAQCDSTEQVQLLASDGFKDNRFGHAVALRGDLLVVGAFQDNDLGLQSGSAWVYRRRGNDWVVEQKLTASDGQSYDMFGYAVATDGNIIAIAASGKDSTIADVGQVYVFRKVGLNWTEQQKFIPDGLGPYDGHQMQLATDGDLIVIGFPLKDFEVGSAFVYRFNGSQFDVEQELKANDGVPNDDFGFAVSVSGNAILVGAAQDSGDGAGKAYVFRDSGSGWIQEQKLEASDGADGDQFGWSVSLRDQRALVGSIADDGARGSAYTFEFSGTSWIEKQKLVAGDGSAGDQFGAYVGLSDRTAVVAAFTDVTAGLTIGSAYAYRHDGNQFALARKLTPSDGIDFDLFGACVATDGEWAVVGNEPHVRKGSAYLYAVPDLPLAATPKQVAPLDQITFECCGGQPNGPVLLAVVDVGGPLFVKVALGHFDPAGVFDLAAVVPPGLTGLTATLQAFGVAHSGQTLASNREAVTFE